MDANEIYLDLQLRYQHRLRRLASRILGRSIELVSLSDRQLIQRLRRKLPVMRRGKFDFAARRYLALMEELRALRQQAIEDAWKEAQVEFKELAYATQDKEEERTLFALPFRIKLSRLDKAAMLAAIALPFAGGRTDARTFDQWKDSILLADFNRIQGAIQSGIVTGLRTEDILRNLAGTRRRNFADGVLGGTRRNLEAVLAAGVTHVHNSVSDGLFEKNPDVYRFLQWVSVLDGRTSAICRSRDGKFAPIGENKLPVGLPRLIPPTARPPAHPNCRSAVVPVFDSRGLAGIIGERPFVRETAKDQYRKINFRQQAKDGVGSAAWRRMSAEQRQRAVDTVRDQWLQDRIGTVPADLTYDDWLRGQPVEFQNEVLGRRKAVLFRKGLKLDRFVDSTGRQLTTEQLRELLE